MRLIDAEALVKEFSTRAVSARNWKENALNNGDEEIVIRADATLAFLTEVKLTIDNAPTVEDRPTVYVVPQECIKVLADTVVDVVQKIDWNSLIKIVAEKEAENEQ